MPRFAASAKYGKPPAEAPPDFRSSVLYVAGCGARLSCSAEDVAATFAEFGRVEDVEMTPNAQFCFVAFSAEEEAAAALAAVTAQRHRGVGSLVGRRLHAKMAARRAGLPPGLGEDHLPPAASLGDLRAVPGLHVLEGFVTEAEEAALMAAELHEAHGGWHAGKRGMGRRVRHWGHGFDYQSRTARLPAPPLPRWLLDLRDRVLRAATAAAGDAADAGDAAEAADAGNAADQWSSAKDCGHSVPLGRGSRREPQAAPRARGDRGRSTETFDQVTANEYLPGQGIAPHVDTPGAFGPLICSLSLGAATVMDFKRGGARAASVPLPRRSLLVMSGPARYDFAHSVPGRRRDLVDGELRERSRRVSLTFRTRTDALPPGRPRTPEVEARHVHQVYDAIAEHWTQTRARRGVLWPRCRELLERLPPGSVVLDVGCGDGRYLGVNEGRILTIGTDRCLPLLRAAASGDHGAVHASALTAEGRVRDPSIRKRRRRGAAASVRRREALRADCLRLPFRSGAADAAVCVAVLHHLSSRERRVACLAELLRCVRGGGLAFVQAWAMEQPEGARRSFAAQENMVPWRLQAKYAAGGADQQLLRYCHAFVEGELEALARDAGGADVLAAGNDRGNWWITLRKRP